MSYVFVTVAVVAAGFSMQEDVKMADRAIPVFMFATIAAVVLRLFG
jgi:hypothetical protein